MPRAVSQKGGVSKSPLPENRLVTNPKRDNKIERGGMVQSNSGKINRGTGIPGQGDGGPSKQKRFK